MARIKYISLVLITILLASGTVYAASFVDDEFTGESLGGQWTTSGPGTVGVSDGYLTITTSSTTFTYVTQEGITGAFDLVAKIKGEFYPNDVSSAQYSVVFYIEIDSINYVYAFQNYDGATPDAYDEAMMFMYVNDSAMVHNPKIPIMENICIRLKRDTSNDFYIYYNESSDCSGDWVEQTLSFPEYRLNSGDPVDVSIRARSPIEKTYHVEYIKELITSFPSISGGTMMIGGCYK